MADWVTQTDRFLVFNEREVLRGPGRVSHDRMEQVAHQRYDAYDSARHKAEAEIAEREAIAELEQLEASATALAKPSTKKASVKKRIMKAT